MTTMQMARWCGSWLLVCLFLAACSDSDGSNGRPVDENPESMPSLDLESLEAFPGRLLEGTHPDDAFERPPRAQTRPLADEDVIQLLERLEPLPILPEDESDFALRPDSEPPPRTGAVIRGEFPPPEEREPPEPEPRDGPLEIVRYSPDGEVPIAGQLSITFDRPMVAVTAHDDLARRKPPIEMTPEIAGQWRWVGTRTLVFEPDAPRLPMATEFEVQVPAGLSAADGQELEAPHTWHFATPPPVMERVHPRGSGIGLEPLMVVEFDQRIDADDMLDQLVVEAGGEAVEVRLATAEEIRDDPAAARLLDRVDPDRVLAFRALDTFPSATTVTIRLPAGSKGDEGPRPTAEDQSDGFRTFGPLLVINKRCATRDCQPTDALILEFSNDLDEEQNLADRVMVEPAIPDMHVSVRGRRLAIEGVKQGRTRYSVHLSENIVDQFGQQLEGGREFRFDTGSLRARMMFPGRGFLTLPTGEPPKVRFYTANYVDAQMTVHRVRPVDWPDYADLGRGRQLLDVEPPELPGESVLDETVTLNAEPDRIMQQSIDLAPWLTENGTGHFVVMIEPGESIGPQRRHGRQRYAAWVQVTGIGLDAAVDHSQMLVWSTVLDDGRPLAEAGIRLGPDGNEAVSDADGVARLALPKRDSHSRWIEAMVGDDVAILPGTNAFGRSTTWRSREIRDQVLWHVFDDRSMYRPGEQVHLKGWLRQEERRPDGGLGLIDGRLEIDYEVTDSRGNVIAEGVAGVGRLGGFELAFELPDTPNLGNASVRFNLGGTRGLEGTSHTHTFQIQEFRTPEFEVSTRIPEGPFVGSTTVQAEVEANYYAGGALAGADTTWTVIAAPGHFRPPNRDEWRFGVDTPWWMPWPTGRDRDGASERFEGQTDGGGIHRLGIDLDMDSRARPLVVTARAAVMDVNRQTWSASSDFIAHAADTYVGLKTGQQFVEQGEPLTVSMITVDLDGEVVIARPVTVEMARIQWQWRAGERVEERADAQHCEVQTDDDGLAECEFTTNLGGQYRITAVTTDAQGRKNATRLTRWVAGGRMPAAAQVEMQEALLIPEREEYAPGDSARVLVQAPFDDAEGLLTLRRHGLAEQRRFSMEGSSKTLEIGLHESWLPGVELQVTLLGQAPAETEGQSIPAIATGSMSLPISTAERALEIDLSPAETRLAPGASTDIDLQVRDVDGNSVADAEIALVVVDEAILALSGYELVDPLGVFYRHRPGGVTDHHMRPSVLTATPEPIEPDEPKMAYEAEMMLADGRGHARMEAGSMEAPSDPIDVREDFNPLAAFVPALRTDEQGKVSTRIRLPDNLTRYRVMAVAVADATHYGIAESAMTARLPLMVRPSAPRFLNFGDTFEFPVVLQNQTDDTLPVEIAIDAANLELTDARGYALEIPANDRVEVRFPAASVNAGIARFQVAAASKEYADAARGELPVWTPATTEAFATYGVIDEGAMIQSVIAPSEVWPQFGQLEITTTATALQSLTDAFIWLCDYPFDATEPLASRLLAIAALADVLEAFGAEGMPDREEIERIVASDLERITARQNPDGGFGLWMRGNESWPFVTLHVAHALVRSRERGYSVDERLFERTMQHVADIERHIPGRYSERTRRHIVAYSLYVRGLIGDLTDNNDRDRARRLIAEVEGLDQLTFESTGWLLGVLTGDEASTDELDELRRFLGNRVTETAAGAQFASAFRDGDHLIMHSDRRADAIILEALMDDQPESDLIPKLVQGLQAHRTRGRWASTQENAFVLVALDKYFRRYEDQEPDFIARAWLGEDFAGEHHFSGRTTEYHHIDIPMSRVVRGSGDQQLILDKDGAGRLYYRIGLSYAPRSLELEPASHGFEVERMYRGVDDENDVRRREDGSWVIRAGARVAVDLTLVAPARRYHVALVDPLPAGLESLNPALGVTDVPEGDTANSQSRGRGWWWGPWYQHQNLRDERTEAFTTLLWGGVYNYTYYARATTPGEFVVPPTRAEEMYHPETFGRSASSRVIVAD
jgi:alpha-2-macroglobulin